MNPAHAHLILNHIPVLGAFSSLLFLIYALWKKDESFVKFTFQWLILVGLLTIPAFLTGEPAEEHIEHMAGVSEALIEAHEDAALYGLILTEAMAALSLLGIFLFNKKPSHALKLIKVLLLVALFNVTAMIRIANLGGEIRHPEIRKEQPPPEKT